MGISSAFFPTSSACASLSQVLLAFNLDFAGLNLVFLIYTEITRGESTMSPKTKNTLQMYKWHVNLPERNHYPAQQKTWKCTVGPYRPLRKGANSNQFGRVNV